jgi:hypothetical protein
VRGRNKEGAITVFLSFIIVLMLAITCSTVEVTRLHIAKMQVTRALNTSMYSVLAEYDQELLEQYGIMSLDGTYGLDYLDTNQMTQRIQYYIQSALLPQSNLQKDNFFYQLFTKKDDDFLDLYGFQIKEIQVHNLKNISDEQGMIFKNQILEYMKYRGPLILVEEFLGKLELVSKSAKTADIIQEKSQLDGQAQEVGDQYLYLMTLIDGIDFRQGKIQIHNQQPQIVSTGFVKGLTFDNKTKELEFANHEQVNEAIKAKVYYAYSDIEVIPETLLNLFIHQIEIYKLEDDIAVVDYEIATLNQTLISERNYKMSIQNQMASIYQQLVLALHPGQVENLMNRLLVLENQLQEVESRIQEIEIAKNQFELERNQLNQQKEKEEKAYVDNYSNYYTALHTLTKTLENIKLKNQEALQYIEEINEQLEEINREITRYEQMLQSQQGEVMNQTYEAMERDLKDLKSQLGLEKEATINLNPFGNIVAMKETLSHNLTVLKTEELYDLAYYYSDSFFNELKGKARNIADSNREIEIEALPIQETIVQLKGYFNKFKAYEIDYLSFDYSDFHIGSEDLTTGKLDPRSNEALKDTGGILDEVLSGDLQEIGQNMKEDLPSHIFEDLQKVLEEEVDFGKTSFANQVLDILGQFGESIFNLPNNLLINEYIIGNFRTATDHLEGANLLSLGNYSMENHYLDYEVEYILEGQEDEQENLKLVSNRIILTRFALNLIHILSSPIKRQTAFSLAMAFMGWSPLAFLVYVAQFLIMCAWSYGEACVDLKLLLDGKRVPFIKTQRDWILSIGGISNFAINTITEEIEDQVDEVVQKSVEKASAIVDKLSIQLEDGAKTYANEKISTVIEDAYRLGYEAVDYMEQQIENTLDQLLREAQQGTDLSQINIAIYDMAGNDLIQDLVHEINANKDDLLAAKVGEVLQVKERIMEKMNSKMESAKTRILNNVEEAIGTSIGQVEEHIKNKLEAGGQELETLAKDQVNHLSQQLKEQIGSNIDASFSNTIQGKDQGLEKVSLSFSYEDYLRLYLLFSDEELKLYRTMDCIQMNLQEIRGNTFALSQQVFAFDATVEVEMDYLFFTLPFMPDEAKNIGKTKYKMKVTVSQAY